MMTVRAHAVVAALGAGVATALAGAAPGTPVHWRPTTRQDSTPRPRMRGASRPQPLAGAYWTRLSAAEKQVYMAGFLAGAAADSGHAPPELRFRFTPPVYSSQLDDYYWYSDHTAVPIADALAAINKEMLAR
jgi:hypothetical protein